MLKLKQSKIEIEEENNGEKLIFAVIALCLSTISILSTICLMTTIIR